MSGNGRNGHRNGTNGNGTNGNGNRRAIDNRQRRRRRNRRQRDKVQSRRFVIVTIIALLLTTAGVLAAAAFTGAQAFLNSCSLASLKPVSIGENSFVYAADGSLLGSIPAEQNRQPVALDQMSPLLAQATVAIEDRRFYSHDGVDYEGIIRAAVKNLQEGEIVQGGSTLTQQLVRNLYIGREVSWERKTTEACLAIKLEEEGLPTMWGVVPAGLTPAEAKAWRKDRILETYLNQVYFGAHAYGAEAAAQTYFAKHASELELAEAALIAGLPQAPSIFDPFQRPEQALARRNDVLRAMRADDYISESALQAALSEPIELKRGQIYTRIKEPFFFSYVREQLIEKYGATLVRSGGLKVYTTINPRYQRIAADSIKEELDQSGDPASAIVSINPRNGAIRAMTAVVPGKKNIQFNIAAQGRRQSGSSFKTFVLTEAIRQGINPYSTQYLSAPFHWQPDPNSEPWDVATYSHSYIGAVPIATGDAQLGQHRLRAPHARRRSRERGPGGAADGHQDGAAAGRVDRARLERRLGAGDGLGVRHPGGRRSVLRADGDPQGRPRRRQRGQGRGLGRLQAEARHGRRGRLRGDPDPAEQHRGRHRNRRGLRRLVRRREDRNDGKLGRRLVRRLHASGLDGRLGRLSERADRHDQRARDHRDRRVVPGVDLEALHVARAQRRAAAHLAVPEEPGDLGSDVHWRVRLRRRAGAAREAQEGQEDDDRRGSADDDRATADDD